MKKKLLIALYNLDIGGIERSLINMLECFDYDQYEVDLLIFDHSGDFMTLIPKKVNVLPQITSYSVFRRPLMECLRPNLIHLFILRMICKWIAILQAKIKKFSEGSGYLQMQYTMRAAANLLPGLAKSYDIAISYAWPHDIIAAKIQAKVKIAWIHTDYSKLAIDHAFDEVAWSKFDYISSVSEQCTETFISQYPALATKVKTIENISSPAFIRMMSNERSIPAYDGEFNLLSVGRLSYVKGYDLAVRALKNLQDQGYNQLKWYVIGYGGYEQELRALIKELQLEESFVLMGKKSNPYPYMKACDLYVQPSRYEGKAVTVTEAQILAKPVLITAYPTSESQVRHGEDGIICDLSVEGIAEAIKNLYLNEDLRQRLKNRLEHRDFGNSDELEKLYELTDLKERLKGAS